MFQYALIAILILSVALDVLLLVELYYAKREAKSMRHAISLLTRY